MAEARNGVLQQSAALPAGTGWLVNRASMKQKPTLSFTSIVKRVLL